VAYAHYAARVREAMTALWDSFSAAPINGLYLVPATFIIAVLWSVFRSPKHRR
jgi:hypothetical protein